MHFESAGGVAELTEAWVRVVVAWWMELGSQEGQGVSWFGSLLTLCPPMQRVRAAVESPMNWVLGSEVDGSH